MHLLMSYGQHGVAFYREQVSIGLFARHSSYCRAGEDGGAQLVQPTAPFPSHRNALSTLKVHVACIPLRWFARLTQYAAACSVVIVNLAHVQQPSALVVMFHR